MILYADDCLCVDNARRYRETERRQHRGTAEKYQIAA